MSLIDPSQFPVLRPEQAEAAADQLRTMGQSVETHATNADTIWQGLLSCYRAPEGDYVTLLLKPALTIGQDIHAAMDRAANILDRYAFELAGLVPALDSLREQAEAFRSSVLNTPLYVNYTPADEGPQELIYWYLPLVVKSWDQWPPTIERNNELLGMAARIMAHLSEVESECGQKIVELLSPARRPAIGIGEPVFPVYDADQFLNSPVPWGEPQKRRYSGWLDNLIWTSYEWGDGTISSIVAFAGVKWGWPPGFSPSLAAESWFGLAMFGFGGALAKSPLAVAHGYTEYQTGDPDFFARSTNLFLTGSTSIVGFDYEAQMAGQDPWHQWRDDPQAAGTNTVYNIVSLIVGAKTAKPKTAPLDAATNVGPLIPDPGPDQVPPGRPTVPPPASPGEESGAPAPVTGTTSTTRPPDLEDHSDPGLPPPAPPEGPPTGTTVPSRASSTGTSTTSTTVPAG